MTLPKIRRMSRISLLGFDLPSTRSGPRHRQLNLQTMSHLHSVAVTTCSCHAAPYALPFGRFPAERHSQEGLPTPELSANELWTWIRSISYFMYSPRGITISCTNGCATLDLKILPRLLEFSGADKI